MEKTEKRAKLSRVLAIAGSVFVLLPVAAPFIFLVPSLGREGGPVFDFLLPGELFPLALVGGLLIFWASRREKLRVKLITLSFAGSLVALVGSQALAVALGLASGRTPAKGLPLIAVLVVYALYPLGLAALGAGGILLAKDIGRRGNPGTVDSNP